LLRQFTGTTFGSSIPENRKGYYSFPVLAETWRRI